MANEMEPINTEELKTRMERAKKHYSNKKLWDKLKSVGKKAGGIVVYAVLLLYYTLQKPSVPVKTKAMIIGALGYFILPIDLIPDFITGVGYVDDLGALGAAILQVATHIDQDIKDKAKNKLSTWFGEDIDTSSIDEKLIN
ncbi:YkvA family protein [Heyndrickxia oleronia]|uniref:YkvA family protein n=1 Tax=Heyndrickxia TaxID=2837504 RepID=UPI0003A5E368